MKFFIFEKKEILNQYLFILLYIIFCNIMFSVHSENYISEFRNIAQTGLDFDRVLGFSNYLNSHGLYPVKELNNNLVMEDGWALRFGRKFHGYLFYLSELISLGFIKNSLIPFNFFIMVSFSYIIFIKLNKNFNFLFAFIFINFLIAHPWLINEFYVKQNIQGYPVILNLLISVLFIDFIKDYKNPPVWLVIISTFLICCFYKINEMNLLCLIQLITIIFFIKVTLKKKIIFLICIATLFLSINKSFDLYFEYKVKEAKEYVKNKNGKVFDLDYNVKHIKWTAFYMSLNEFEKNLNTGFWNDWLTYPIIFEKNNLEKDNKIFESSKNGYLIHPHSYKNTENIFKNKTLALFKNDKIIFIKLIYLRTAYFFQNLSPFGMNLLVKNIYISNKNTVINIFNFGIFFLFLITYAIKENREIYFIFSLTFLTIVPGLVFKVTHGISFSFIGHYLIFAYLISDSIKIIWKKYLKFF